MRNKLRAEKTFRRHGGKKNGVEASIPSEVRDHLGAVAGDRVIFEDGCEENVRRALERGLPFVIVRRPPRAGERVPTPSGVKLVKAGAPQPEAAVETPEPLAPEERAEAAPPPAAGESFAAFVKGRCGRAGDPTKEARR